MCARCRRPESVCYCEHVVEIATRTRVVILQHPRERDVPINTARIAALCLPNAQLHVGIKFGGTKALADATSDPAHPPILLYPAPDAVDIEAHPPDSPRTLIVLDGTWWQASKLWKENPELHAIPRYAFRPRAPSDYRIRKEPQEDYVSTLEALAHVLGVLEGDSERLLAMREPFRAMVDAQLAHAAKGGGSRHVSQRKDPDGKPRERGPRRKLPKALRDYRPGGDSTLVCIYGEANGFPYGSIERTTAREEIIHWLAHRVDTGETFERIVRTDSPLASGTSKHCRLSEEEVHAGISFAELTAQFSAFLKPSDVLCSWGAYAPNVYERSGGVLPAARVDLRASSRAFVEAIAPIATRSEAKDAIDATKSRVRTMDDLLARLAPERHAITCEGDRPTLGRARGGERLAQVCAVARTLIG